MLGSLLTTAKEAPVRTHEKGFRGRVCLCGCSELIS